MDTKVLIIGGGPSGLLLSLLLSKNDIDNIILEKNTALHVANRIRAGILEPGTVKILKKGKKHEFCIERFTLASY